MTHAATKSVLPSVLLRAALIVFVSLVFEAVASEGATASSGTAASGTAARTPITMFQLDNGLRILVLPDSATPTVSVGLWIGAGWVHNPRGREGLADLCAATRERVVRRAILGRKVGKPYLNDAFSSGVSTDHSGFGVTALAEDLDPAITVMRAVVEADGEGNGPNRSFSNASTLKGDALLNLLRTRFSPGLVAGEAMATVLFGDRRPLGFSARFQTLLGLLPADVRQFHRDHYRPANAILTVDGAARPEVVRAAVARHFGDWKMPGQAEPPAWGHAADAPAHPGVTLIDDPDAGRAVILAGLAGPGRESPDFPGLQLLHQVIGGKRVEDPLATLVAHHPAGYQLQSHLRVSARGSQLMLEVVVPHELATQSLTELRRALEGIAKSGIDSTAVAAEVLARSQNVAFRFETSRARVREAVFQLLAGQPLATAENPVGTVAALNRRATMKQWQALLEPGRIVWVILGRGDELAAKLTAAGIDHQRGDPYEVVTGRLLAPDDAATRWPKPAAIVQAEELILAAIEAKGGFEALERIETYTLEDSLFVKPLDQIVRGTRKTSVRFPDRFREDLGIETLQGRGVIQVVNGRDVWRNQLGKVTGTSTVRRKDLLARQWLDGLRVFHRYGEPGATAFLVDPDLVGSTILDGFQITSPEGYWVRIYLHPTSRLVVKRATERPADEGVFQTEELFTDYRPIEGVFVPFVSATYLDGDYSSETHTAALDFNVALDQDLFTRQ